MIIGDNKERVIDNIKKATENGEYNKKVEIGDPDLTAEEQEEKIRKYMAKQDKLGYKINNKIANVIL